MFGPTLGVNIGFDIEFYAGGSQRAELPSALWQALVDTGAGISCIDSELAHILELPIIDRGTISGSHGAHECNIHLAQISILSLDSLTLYGQFAGVHLAAGGQPHQALIGRDFLQYFTMDYNGRTGSVILSDD